MCKVKKGQEIKTIADAKNMIVSTILGQEQRYRVSDIVELVNNSLNESPVKLTSYDIFSEVHSDIDIFYQNGIIETFNDGTYLTV